MTEREITARCEQRHTPHEEIVVKKNAGGALYHSSALIKAICTD
jgi:hypothetical protein